jgi:ribokinase
MNNFSARSPAHVIVVGSVNMDITVQVRALPAIGETVSGSDAELLLGGKGANQAIAAKRLGATVLFVARVGEDSFGTAALEALACEKLDLSTTLTTKGVSTGIALITLGQHGQNTITLSPGANACLVPADLEPVASSFSSQSVLLLQNEVPVAVSRHAASVLRDKGGMIILDPAPATGFDPSLLPLVDIVTPNETEACALTGIAIKTRKDALAAAQWLVGAGARIALIKMGSEGVVYAGACGEGHVRAPVVTAVNTVAAGDCFNGALAVALGEGLSFEAALDFACRAAAISVTRHGASASMPLRDDLEQVPT